MISTGTKTKAPFSLEMPEDLDYSNGSMASTDPAVSEWIHFDSNGNTDADIQHDPPSHFFSVF